MKMFLKGEWADGSKCAEVVNPYNGDTVDTVPVGTAADITPALDGLVEGAKLMRAMPVHQRVEILRKTGRLIQNHQQELGRLISTEEGKVLAEGLIEAGRAEIMPYGGLKDSGFGKEGPKYAVNEMTEIKMVIFH
ncbi:MAG: aldehyde dehydrogenase family protein [Verrucomicrobiota bacterium]|nr:aldehyde dehydrogenase family protein [Verrucomicrobiota bacterium]